MKKRWQLFGAVLLAVLMLSACSKAVDLKSITRVDFRGPDGYGKASAYIDNDAVRDNLFKKHKVTLEKILQDPKRYAKLDAEYNAMTSIEVRLAEDKKNLKNGDKIQLNYSANEDLMKKAGLKLKENSLTVTVEGLKQPIKANPFDDLEVTFEGYEGKGSMVRLDKKGKEEWSRYVTFKVDGDTEGLKNGDTMKVKAKVSDSAAEAGYILEPTEKEYTVSGLEKAKEINPLELVKVTYEGKSPLARLIFDEDGLRKEGLAGVFTFEASKTENIKNGDEIAISYKISGFYDEGKYKIVGEKSKKITVEGLKESLQTLSDSQMKTLMALIDAEAGHSMRTRSLKNNWWKLNYDQVAEYGFKATPVKGFFIYETDSPDNNLCRIIYEVSLKSKLVEEGDTFWVSSRNEENKKYDLVLNQVKETKRYIVMSLSKIREESGVTEAENKPEYIGDSKTLAGAVELATTKNMYRKTRVEELKYKFTTKVEDNYDLK